MIAGGAKPQAFQAMARAAQDSYSVMADWYNRTGADAEQQDDWKWWEDPPTLEEIEARNEQAHDLSAGDGSGQGA